MKSLRGKLLELEPRKLTEVEHRRARTRLLEAASERARPRTRPLVVIAAALAVAGVVFFVHSRHEPAKLGAVVAQNPPMTAAAPAPALGAPPPTSEPTTDEAPPAPPVIHAPRPKSPAVGATFDKAFSDFEKGNYGVSDLEFESFLHEFPSDPRAEDASYLRAVARYRLGDRQGAAMLAHRYLEKYPSGLRRPEAERIAQAE